MRAQVNVATGRVVLIQSDSLPPYRDGEIVVELSGEDEALLPDGGPFLWIPDDIEEPEAGGHLEKVDPPKRVPREMSAWQAKAAMAITGLGEGTLLDAVEAALAAMDEGPDKAVLLAAWNNNASFLRTSPAVTSVAAGLGLDDDQLDDLFILGKSLSV